MLCVLFKMTLSVRMNVIQPKSERERFTAERVARTRSKTYRAIVRLLADPDAKIEHIAKLHRVSTHTVRAIREREALEMAQRKQRLMSIFANVAEIAGERMEELAGQASLRDAGTTAGIATDKLLALSGEPALTIQHSIEPGPNLYQRLAELAASIKPIKPIQAAVVEPVTSQRALPNGETISDSGAENGLPQR